MDLDWELLENKLNNAIAERKRNCILALEDQCNQTYVINYAISIALEEVTDALRYAIRHDR